MTERPIFAMSQESRLLIMTLKAANIGDVVSDADIERATGKALRDLTGAFQTAFKRLMRDENMVFGRIRKVGYKRLADGEIVASGSRDAERIRKQAKRSVERQMQADFDRLSSADKAQFTANVSILGAVAMMTKPKSLNTVAEIAKPDTRELPIAQTLRMFSPDAA